MHSTCNLNDGYLGSGKRLAYEITKYGIENFERVILEEVSTRKELADRERQVVNENLLKEKLCLNLKIGGEGGGGFYSKQQQVNATHASNRSKKRDYFKIALKSHITKKIRGSGNYFGCKQSLSFKGKKHSIETKMKIGKANSIYCGERSSQYGKHWMNNNVHSLLVKGDEVGDYISNGYIFGRKSTKVIEYKICDTCGVKFTPIKSKTRFCSVSCSSKGPRGTSKIKKECLECCKHFETYRKTQLCCCQSCGVKHHNKFKTGN